MDPGSHSTQPGGSIKAGARDARGVRSPESNGVVLGAPFCAGALLDASMVPGSLPQPAPLFELIQVIALLALAAFAVYCILRALKR